MEVTKWLKPSISVSRIGDSASVQAVNASERRASLPWRFADAGPGARRSTFMGPASANLHTSETLAPQAFASASHR